MAKMIVDALLAAEPVFHLAEAIDDPAKYLHVTDSIIEDIERRDDPVSKPLGSLVCMARLQMISALGKVEKYNQRFEMPQNTKGMSTRKAVCED